jgi:hypothetical protein
MIRQHGMTGRLLPGILPSLLLGLASSAAGELLGYALGAGHASEDTVDLDMNRWRYVTDREKEELWSGQLLQFSHDPPLPGQKATL